VFTIIDNDLWYCPATEKEIDTGLCWEYCFIDKGGPIDTDCQLKRWIEQTKQFKDIEEFHKVCEKCNHCQWSK
jgi:hypothetical protein